MLCSLISCQVPASCRRLARYEDTLNGGRREGSRGREAEGGSGITRRSQLGDRGGACSGGSGPTYRNQLLKPLLFRRRRTRKRLQCLFLGCKSQQEPSGCRKAAFRIRNDSSNGAADATFVRSAVALIFASCPPAVLMLFPK